MKLLTLRSHSPPRNPQAAYHCDLRQRTAAVGERGLLKTWKWAPRAFQARSDPKPYEPMCWFNPAPNMSAVATRRAPAEANRKPTATPPLALPGALPSCPAAHLDGIGTAAGSAFPRAHLLPSSAAPPRSCPPLCSPAAREGGCGTQSTRLLPRDFGAARARQWRGWTAVSHAECGRCALARPRAGCPSHPGHRRLLMAGRGRRRRHDRR